MPQTQAASEGAWQQLTGAPRDYTADAQRGAEVAQMPFLRDQAQQKLNIESQAQSETSRHNQQSEQLDALDKQISQARYAQMATEFNREQALRDREQTNRDSQEGRAQVEAVHKQAVDAQMDPLNKALLISQISDNALKAHATQTAAENQTADRLRLIQFSKDLANVKDEDWSNGKAQDMLSAGVSDLKTDDYVKRMETLFNSKNQVYNSKELVKEKMTWTPDARAQYEQQRGAGTPDGQAIAGARALSSQQNVANGLSPDGKKLAKAAGGREVRPNEPDLQPQEMERRLTALANSKLVPSLLDKDGNVDDGKVAVLQGKLMNLTYNSDPTKRDPDMAREIMNDPAQLELAAKGKLQLTPGGNKTDATSQPTGTSFFDQFGKQNKNNQGSSTTPPVPYKKPMTQGPSGGPGFQPTSATDSSLSNSLASGNLTPQQVIGAGGARTADADLMSGNRSTDMGGAQPIGDGPTSPGQLTAIGDGPTSPSQLTPLSGPGGGEDRVLGGKDLKGTDPRLTEIVQAAAQALPAGYMVRPTSGVRTEGQGQHTLGKATDWEIVDPNGKTVENRGNDASGLYTTLAKNAYGYQEKYHPDLTGQFQWGGQFGTSASNPNEPDLMHFDIGGRRGRIGQYSRESIGSALPGGDQTSSTNSNTANPDLNRSPLADAGAGTQQASTADSGGFKSGLLRAMAYGPSQGEFSHDTLNGPLGALKQGDLALSPDQLGQFPLGSYVNVVGADGKTILQRQRIADYSYYSPGKPTSSSFEVWNGQDLGHAHLVAASDSGGGSGGGGGRTDGPFGDGNYLQDEAGNEEVYSKT